VKEQLRLLKVDVVDANKACLKNLERTNKSEKQQIKQLKDLLKVENKRNNQLESRLTRLENMLKNDAENRVKVKGNAKVQASGSTKVNDSHGDLTLKTVGKYGKQAVILPSSKKLEKQEKLTALSKREDTGSSSYFKKAQMYLLHGVQKQSDDTADAQYFAGTINSQAVIKEPVLIESPLEWAIRKQNPTSVLTIQHGRIFYTSTPGYRIQFRAQIDQMHGDLYFSVRILKGVFDDQLKWPMQEEFKICLSDRTNKSESKEFWSLPVKGSWGKNVRKPTGKLDKVVSDWNGPFDISRYLERETIYLLIKYCF